MLKAHKNIRPHQPKRSLLKATHTLSEAPLDPAYGSAGHAYFTEYSQGTKADTDRLLKSKARPNRYYVTGVQTNRGEPENVFIACLDTDGKPDISFNGKGLFNFNDLQVTDYRNVGAVLEDAAGNLLLGLQPYRQSTTHLWKLTPAGEPDTTFGGGKGYIDTTTMLGKDLILERMALHEQGYMAAGLQRGAEKFEAVLVALTPEGALDTAFAQGGVLDVTKLVDDSRSVIIDGLAITSPATGEPRILLPLYLMRNADAYSVTCALTLDGVIDDAFGDKGQHWSEPWIINQGFFVDEGSERITLYGEHYSIDEDISQPTLYRLDLAGKPALEFNNGQLVRFDGYGSWNSIVEFEGSLVGYGSFYTHAVAVRYDTTGQLDTTFVPPDGYGQLGAQLPQDGFYTTGTTGEKAVVIDTENLRMLVNGRDEQLQKGFTVPCVVAISLKPE